jgi:hypothetical protein
MTTPLADVPSADSLLVFSHLRWGAHWQRPQQLCARLARHREVLFVEPPRFLDDLARPRIEQSVSYPGIHRLVTKLPVEYRLHERVTEVTVRTLLIDLLGPFGAFADRLAAPILWFFTPMPAPTMIGAFDERLIVYDPMPTSAVHAIDPVAFHEREALLLRHANLVFADQDRESARDIRHRTIDAWDTLVADIDRLLRDVCANRRSAGPTTTPAAVPGWAAAMAIERRRR